MAANGRFLNAGNRLHDLIATFAIGPDGVLRNLDDTPTGGEYPRHIALGPRDGCCVRAISAAT